MSSKHAAAHVLKKSREERTASGFFESLKVDLVTIRTILLTAAAMLLLILTPLGFLLKHFVTFDALDNYLKLTDAVRPKILSSLSENVSTGYSKNFIFSSDGPSSPDTTMLFYAMPGQRVSLTVHATPIEGPVQAVTLQVNGHCMVQAEDGVTESLHLYQRDITQDIAKCPGNEPNLQSLRIVLPQGLKKSSILHIQCLVLVDQPVIKPAEEPK